MARKKKKRTKKRSNRFILFFAILAITLTLVIVGNEVIGQSLRRLYYLISEGITGSADEVTIRFDASNANRFHAIDGGFAVLSSDGIHIYAYSGEKDAFTPLNYHSPALAGGDETIIAYDRNGQQFTVHDDSRTLYTGKTEAPIVNISLGYSDDFTVITAGPDCKSLVTAYDEDFKQLYRLHSSEQYIIAAPISEDEDYMATLGFSASTGQFNGRITFYRLNREGAYKYTDLGDCMPLSARFTEDDELIVLCEDRLLRFNDKCELKYEIPFEGMGISNASLHSREIASVLLDGHSRGGATRLIVAGDSKTPLIFNFNENIFDVSSAGDYTALLLSDRIVVYNEDGEEYHTFRLAQSAKECIMRSDGTVFAVGQNYANLLIP